jgi:hypothetical protein
LKSHGQAENVPKESHTCGHLAQPASFPKFFSGSERLNRLRGSYFRVQSGDDEELTLDMIKGKVAAIFYENKDIVDANKRLKDELNCITSRRMS